MNKFVALLVVVVVLLYINTYASTECFTNPPKKENNVHFNDPDAQTNNSVLMTSPNNEVLIYDNVSGSVMSGTQFMENTGIVAPRWIAPAWDPDADGPASLGNMNPSDYENDPRMLYNKCSLSCCSAQYPTPFQDAPDPLVCDKDGNNKYLSSDYNCTNNAGGTGCLCMSDKQSDGLQNGFVDYYANEKLGY